MSFHCVLNPLKYMRFFSIQFSCVIKTPCQLLASPPLSCIELIAFYLYLVFLFFCKQKTNRKISKRNVMLDVKLQVALGIRVLKCWPFFFVVLAADVLMLHMTS